MRRHALIALTLTLALTGSSLIAEEREPRVVDLGNGRFQLALDPAVGTEPPARLGGAIEWEYAGQATYVKFDATKRVRMPELRTIEDEGPTDTLTRLLRSEMEDRHGRLFRVKRVDRARLQRAIDSYDVKVRSDFGLEPQSFDEGDLFLDDEPEAGAGFVPLTWYRIDQDGDGDDDLFRWNEDDREAVDSPLTERQKKVVVYFFGDAGRSNAGMCTGVLVGDYWVLTAAHCTRDDRGDWIYANDGDPGDGRTEALRGKVCTRGNRYPGTECANVVYRWGNGSWGGPGDMGDDIVVMLIDEPLGQGNYMALSQAGNGTLKDHDAYNLGHPGSTPGGFPNVLNAATPTNPCAPPTGIPLGGFEEGTPPCESRMFWSNDSVHYTSNKVIGTRVDMSAGHSGGPIYYYPNGVDPDASHFLTGIVSGYHVGWKKYTGGAKVPYHRDWIIGIMDDN